MQPCLAQDRYSDESSPSQSQRAIQTRSVSTGDERAPGGRGCFTRVSSPSELLQLQFVFPRVLRSSFLLSFFCLSEQASFPRNLGMLLSLTTPTMGKGVGKGMMGKKKSGKKKVDCNTARESRCSPSSTTVVQEMQLCSALEWKILCLFTHLVATKTRRVWAEPQYL
jgi:hypothetical protein